jgi:hypothetical protein
MDRISAFLAYTINLTYEGALCAWLPSRQLAALRPKSFASGTPFPNSIATDAYKSHATSEASYSKHLLKFQLLGPQVTFITKNRHTSVHFSTNPSTLTTSPEKWHIPTWFQVKQRLTRMATDETLLYTTQYTHMDRNTHIAYSIPTLFTLSYWCTESLLA